MLTINGNLVLNLCGDDDQILFTKIPRFIKVLPVKIDF